MNRQPVVMLSSGGKDSLYMLETLRSDPAWRVEALITTVSETNGRVAMHGTSEALLRMQAESLGLELTTVGLPTDCDNREYERRLDAALRPYRERGIDTIACGDLFLEDIRQWRQASFEAMGWQPVFPIWHTPTDTLAERLIRDPWHIVVTCIDTRRLPESLLGARLDADFIAQLPEGVDPCGENGEFHTFVCRSPGFSETIAVRPGRRHLAHECYLMIDMAPV
ncbi:MAG: ATP-binding protein [Gammaproteobacteria bacterium]|jgi:uncharacterized protein (TIGR00290 family)|nr:ATP-binding protein [Gammaproteobacteria bacterium]